MYGSPYKGILKGTKGTVSVGIVVGQNLVTSRTVANAANVQVGTLETRFGRNVVQSYRYTMAQKYDYATSSWVAKGDNAKFEIYNGTTLRASGTPGAGTYSVYVRSEDQDSWVNEQKVTVTVT